ncbi:LysR family transcriptional regulator [Allosediminivita pacifica]|uniref:DNA-binding transcriptional LysR family regulator n=1 Tax=Allosediminivita pacifica TaxID=1267769 RepID=A0A2T6AJE8_9RHOB|nr:LysR family transcriptional regulator [Allosediminivita pacifica]PTX43945.1 DNA-binding transcriptional LysR family regulator [Allosediminivita pacifica]GGB21486.1 LysR family transcriptional regulator [Allosediminivita pacifica]
MDRAIEQFVAVAEEGSVMAGAERLRLSQPTLSYNIKRLEASLGVPLFHRSARGVQLTTYGETLYNSAVVIGRLYSNALTTIARQKAELEEGISIGTGYSTWFLILRDYLVDHFKAHPNAPINLSIGNMMRCMDQLLAGDISLFIGHQIDQLKEGIAVDFIPIGRATDGYFVRRGHPLLGAERTLDEIRAYPTTMAYPLDVSQKRLVSGGELHDASRLGHAFTSNSLGACLDFVQATDAVLIHSTVLAEHLGAQGVDQVALRPGQEVKKAVMGIHVLPERQSNPKVQACIRAILDRAEQLQLFPPQ